MGNTNSSSSYDLIIVGGGAMGMATAHYAAQSASRILVIDRFDYFLPSSSRLRSNSAGGTRQFRVQYSEEYMASLALQAKPFWDELEQQSQAELVSKVGSLWFGDPQIESSEGQILQAMKVMDSLEISYTKLTADNIEKQYQFAKLPKDWLGFFQADGGTIDVGHLSAVLRKGPG